MGIFINHRMLITLTAHEDIEKDLNAFEEHWMNISKELKDSEVSPREAQNWRRKFRIREKEFLWSHTLSNTPTYEINAKLKNIEDFLKIGLMAGQKNYRDTEGVRLKNKFGSLGELYYWFKEVMKKI